MTDTAIVADQSPFITFYQKTRGQNLMATRLDYIFVEDQYAQYCKRTFTKFGNSDHLMVVMHNEIINELNMVQSQRNWDIYKNKIQAIIRTTELPKAPEC
ncbi:38179_t:CDS:2, partial [Gigaspora margarita]